MYWQIFIVAIVLGVITTNSGHAEKIIYSEHIKPIIDKKCVVFHACFDAPCQLVLTHAEGFQRGANKQPVYDGARVSPVKPTRLFIDARSTLEWRERNFFAVLPENSRGDSASNANLLEQMILLHGTHAFKPNSRLPETMGFGLKRNNECPSAGEIDAYKKAFPYGGMPLGVTGLTDSERQALLDWISQGARIDPPAVHLSAAEQREVQAWEQFLNHKSLRRQLVARWLYEHLFIAHLYFRGLDSENFFKVVRSSTPPGKPVELIVTRRPNDDPQQPFFYRLQPVRGTIVYKTHVTFALDEGLLNRINALFLKDGWGVDRLPGYADDERSNPFKTFAPIPARARYRFMLEHAEYFVQTYIRGPVCHGQIATDVIRDQFWVFFQSPESDLYVTSAEYRNQSTPFMDIAGVEQDLLEGAKTWLLVKTQYDRYSEMRQTAYEQPHRRGADLGDIWDGGVMDMSRYENL